MNNRRRKKLSRRMVDAATFGRLGQVGALLQAGADPAWTDAEGTTPLYAASVQGAAPVVRLLLRAGASPDTESGYGTEGTPLCGAACWGHGEAVRELLAHGADPDLREDHGTGNSPLDWAVAGGHDEVERLLLEAGARR